MQKVSEIKAGNSIIHSWGHVDYIKSAGGRCVRLISFRNRRGQSSEYSRKFIDKEVSRKKMTVITDEQAQKFEAMRKTLHEACGSPRDWDYVEFSAYLDDLEKLARKFISEMS